MLRRLLRSNSKHSPQPYRARASTLQTSRRAEANKQKKSGFANTSLLVALPQLDVPLVAWQDYYAVVAVRRKDDFLCYDRG
jgi:hypothetical protein